MRQHRLAFLTAVGLIVVVFLSACGVALAPVEFTAEGPAVLSPTIAGLHLPALQPAVKNATEGVQRYQVAANTSLYADHPGSCHLSQ